MRHLPAAPATRVEPKGIREVLTPVMQSKNVGLDAVLTAAELIAEDARFNLWILKLKETPSLRADSILELIEDYEELHYRVQAAADKFAETGNAWELNRKLKDIKAEIEKLSSTKNGL